VHLRPHAARPPGRRGAIVVRGGICVAGARRPGWRPRPGRVLSPGARNAADRQCVEFDDVSACGRHGLLRALWELP
jgi:hypothetical protein